MSVTLEQIMTSRPWLQRISEEERDWLDALLRKNVDSFTRHLKAMPAVNARKPQTDAERALVAGAWAHRGRGELVRICGASAAAAQMALADIPTLSFLYDHIADESHHAVEMIKWAAQYDTHSNHWMASAQWEGRWGEGASQGQHLLYNPSWMDYVLYMFPIETGAGIGVRPYELFAIQIPELTSFVDEELEGDENEHFLFFMLAARRLYQNPSTRKAFQDRLMALYRDNIENVLGRRIQFWDAVFVPQLGADAAYCHAIPEFRRDRYQFVLDMLEIPEHL